MTLHRQFGRLCLFLAAVCILVPGAFAQVSRNGNGSGNGNGNGNGHKLPPRLSLSGAVTAGFYHSGTDTDVSLNQNSMLSSVTLNLSGYYHHPKFLSYEIKPQMSLGRQTSESLFPGGRGISAAATFLGGSAFPLTVSYTKLNRQISTFGPLERLAGLQADTGQSSFNVNWRMRMQKLPQITFDLARYSDSYEPLVALTSKVKNKAHNYSLGVQDTLWGWQLDSMFRQERSESDMLNVFDPSEPPYHMTRNSRELRASATRDFSSALSLNIMGGHTNGKSSIASRPYDQTYSYAYGNAALWRDRRLSGRVRAGWTSNLIGYQLERALGSPGTPPGGGPLTLLPFEGRVTLLTFSGQVQYILTKDLRIDSELLRDSTHSPQGAIILGPQATMTTVQSGVTYGHDFRLMRVQGRYSNNVGSIAYGQNPSSRLLGHNLYGSVSYGDVRIIELTASGQFYTQSTESSSTLRSHNAGAGFSAARMLGANWKIRAGYNFDRSTFQSGTSDYRSTGNIISVNAIHRRMEFAFAHQFRNGLTFQPSLRLGLVSPSQIPGIVSAFPNVLAVPSTYSTTYLMGSIRPFRNLTGRFSWNRNTQLLSGHTSNRYNQAEFWISYKFRRLTLDSGYIRHMQDYGVGHYSQNRYFFRVIREFNLF